MISSIIQKLSTFFNSKSININTVSNKLEEEKKSLIAVINSRLEGFNPIYEIKDNIFNVDYPISFGIEIEFKLDEPKVEKLLKFLVHNRLGYEKNIVNKSEAQKLNGWKLSEEINGVYELISPVLKDLEHQWSQILVICEKLKNLGAFTDDNCAFHVHIGSTGLFSSGKHWINLRNLYRYMEPITYLLSAGTDIAIPEERIEHFAVPLIIADKSLYCKGIPIEDALKKLENNEDIDYSFTILYASKYVGLNLRNLNKDNMKTIEFRTFNGTLDPTLIQTYISYAVSIVLMALNSNVEFDNYSNADCYHKPHAEGNVVQIKLSYLINSLDIFTTDLQKRLLWFMNQNRFEIPKYVYNVLIGKLSEEKRKKLL